MTERLTPSDAAFVYAEDPTTPSHMGGVVIIAPAGGFDFERVMAAIGDRLGELPRFRQVVRMVPGNVARPVWTDDARFDLAYHVRRSSLPQPGTQAQLAELVGRLLSRPLDRGRPLWEIYLVEGLADGRVALINKTHQALVGGISAVDIAAAMLDNEPDPDRGPSAVWAPAPQPSTVDLLVDAVIDVVAQPTSAIDAARLWSMNLRATATTVVDTGLAMAEVARRSVHRTTGGTATSALTAAVPGPRVYAAAEVDLETVKRIRRAHGTTVNDVILAVVAGAIRSWMLARGHPVDGSTEVSALAPMSIRAEDPDAPAAVTSYLIDLPVGEPSAVMRLHQVAFHTRSSAASGRRLGADSLLALGRFAPATLHALGARVAGQLSRRSYDLLITNVPGPQHELFAAGYPVVAMYPVVPLVKGHAVAIGCTSYRGRVHVGLTADRDAMPEVSAFAGLVVDAADELAGTIPSTTPPRGRPGTARRAQRAPARRRTEQR